MRIISFAETTPALLAGRKTVTRREWSDRYGASFKAGELLQAWDKNPRTKQGKRVATIRLTAAPYREPAHWIPEPPKATNAEASAMLYAAGGSPVDFVVGPVLVTSDAEVE